MNLAMHHRSTVAASPPQRQLRSLGHRLNHFSTKRTTVKTTSSAASPSWPSGSSGDAAPQDDASEQFSIRQFLGSAWKFTRPHTIRGTLLGTTALVTKALLENSHLVDWALLPRALMGLIALLCGNGYIVGINQIYDVDIDAVNKPFLPIASGALTSSMGWALCSGFAVVGMALTTIFYDRLIAILYSFGLLLGTIYSVPPLRLKRFAIPAFLIIATVRGVLLNFGVYHATRSALGLSFQWSPPIAFITGFVTLFACAIAITKDLPDIEGDKKYGIRTFATEMGVRRITALGSGLLLINYIAAITAALKFGALFNVPVMVGAHAVLAAALISMTVRLDRREYSPAAIRDYYRSIWNLFYSEYFILPFL